MIYRCYALRDKMTGYSFAGCKMNDDAARRDFEMMILSDPNPTLINCHPEDYELYYVGDFNTDTAEFEKVFPIELIAKGESYVQNKVHTKRS